MNVQSYQPMVANLGGQLDLCNELGKVRTKEKPVGEGPTLSAKRTKAKVHCRRSPCLICEPAVRRVVWADKQSSHDPGRKRGAERSCPLSGQGMLCLYRRVQIMLPIDSMRAVGHPSKKQLPTTDIVTPPLQHLRGWRREMARRKPHSAGKTEGQAQLSKPTVHNVVGAARYSMPSVKQNRKHAGMAVNRYAVCQLTTSSQGRERIYATR